ncbi:MAG: hypothetical protein NT168_16275, partial [Planctomycetota bacterium]|nr:hypothetical protein [Planctomycetota bacterium]
LGYRVVTIPLIGTSTQLFNRLHRRTSHLSPDGGGLTRTAVHRLAAGGYDLAADGWGSHGRSHLSPDGGGLTRTAVHRLAADGYDLAYFALE